jgi:predicted O-linked N-acetylglucosamine transferase (SPINDLY family)
MVGYFNTTGLSTMDYRITDQHMDPIRQAQGGPVGQAQGGPPGETEHPNTEKLIRIDPSCWCYTPEPGAPEVTEPPVLKSRFVMFGSLNKVVKVSEPCARLWARVLEAVPGSRLLVSVAGDAAPVVHKQLAAFGLSPDRVGILDKVRTTREYLDRFSQIDIALDTWPFNGITTTCDGLWMGVPCVSMTGQTSVSRAGKSILHAAGLGEFATETPDAFVAAATALAQDLDRLIQIRRSMRDRLVGSPLMDHRGFARNLEVAYLEMWRAWCGAGPYAAE